VNALVRKEREGQEAYRGEICKTVTDENKKQFAITTKIQEQTKCQS